MNEKVMVEAVLPTYYERTRKPGDRFHMTPGYANYFERKGIVKRVAAGADEEPSKALAADTPAGGGAHKRTKRRSLTASELGNRALQAE